MEEVAEIDRLPIDLLAHIFALVNSFTDLAQASSVCRKWKEGVKHSLARRQSLSFAGLKMDDLSTARIIGSSYNLKELDISRSCWGCQITDNGLYEISLSKCIANLTSISLWAMTGITDKGVILLISRASSLQRLNIGGAIITDDSLFAIANSCPNLKVKTFIGVRTPKLKIHFIMLAITWVLSLSCRHVTEIGLLNLVNKCRNLGSINAWGTQLPVDCFIALLTISPALQIKHAGIQMNIASVSMLPVA